MEKRGAPPAAPPRGPVLHIVVVGFHHKKGCQVRGAVLGPGSPPLVPGWASLRRCGLWRAGAGQQRSVRACLEETGPPDSRAPPASRRPSVSCVS